ncbi:MAG: MgtC/SapB family protein [Candidatus Omnitrophica bacterium]|jgi:putative Mg2+ transporter-C (MgtC) family protein|nr:MgtC/SapB family protein [Candidatus Omnitrophota bacterium]MDD3275306.1 MgtC/SapB family protein [Candidatus Omnitrophota bacterium]MDD5078289.1 MgtC/SapB family protein [Candidatus Omnitrophota bacterium]MDD5725479.1 MgtC/SapB family protein [Candidatus Omnitrophota bacterium]
MPTDTQIIIRLLLTLVVSGLIGLERQVHRRDAGLRTHILVALGSCLIMLTSLYVFDIYKDQVPLDPVRIAAGVVTGIGFLGAGTIIRESDRVRGLTTAASLWVVAGIGLAIGVGCIKIAVYTTVLVLLSLHFLRYLEIPLSKEAKNGV